MKINDKAAAAMTSVLKRYVENAKVPIQVEGTPLDIHPQYISGLARILREELISYVNGEKLYDAPQVDPSSCILFTCHVGRDVDGSNVNYGGMGDVTDNPRLLQQSLDDVLDHMIKRGAVNYLAGVSERILVVNAPSLMTHEFGEPVVYTQPTSAGLPCLDSFEAPFLEATKAFYSLPGFRKCIAYLNLHSEESMFVDTKGNDIRQNREQLVLTYRVLGDDEHGEDMEIGGSVFFAGRKGFDQTKLEKRIAKAVIEYQEQRRAIKIPSGSYPIILDGAAAGTFVHEALGAHLLSGKYVGDNDSTVFSLKRVGKRVIPKFLTITDDPTIEGGFGSYEYDDEGVKAQRVVLVESGILRNYLLDLSSAGKMSRLTGTKILSNGHSRSEWAIDEDGSVIEPEPRVTNLIVESSFNLPEEKLHQKLAHLMKKQGSEYGLILEGGGGSVMIQTGMFMLNPSRAWAVDATGNRRLVKGLYLVGNPDELFGDIVATGLPYRSGYGHCGSGSGSVPTQERSPAFLLNRASCVVQEEVKETKRLLGRGNYDPG